MIKNDIVKIKYRWIFIFLIMLGMAITTIQGEIEYGGRMPNIYEIVLTQTDQSNLICFLFTFLYLVVIADIGMQENQNIFRIFLFAIVFMMLFVIANIAICIIQQVPFINKWTDVSNLEKYKLFPIQTAGISLLYLLLRLGSMGLFTALLNRLTKVKIWSILTVILISIIDCDFISIFNLNSAVSLLPVVNTKASYIEDLLPMMPGSQRVSYLFSFIYWSIIILALVSFNIIRLKSLKKRIESHDKID